MKRPLYGRERGNMNQSAVAPRDTRRSGTSLLLFLSGLVLLAGLLVCVGCRNTFLSDRDNDIQEATHAIQTARDDAQRAKAHSSRGTAYSEKARFSRIMKLIPPAEYERLFDLAIQDHNLAVALNPANAEIYFNRAQAYYDRGSLDLLESNGGSRPLSSNPWFDAAAVDFQKAAATDTRNYMALDLLGLTYEQNSQPDQAIQAYTREMALNRLGKSRLADAYCNIGYRHQVERDFAAATAAYRKSIEFGVADDKSCPVEPFETMLALYITETRQYDKAWELVHQAEKMSRRIAPELMERLKKDSARTN